MELLHYNVYLTATWCLVYLKNVLQLVALVATSSTRKQFFFFYIKIKDTEWVDLLFPFFPTRERKGWETDIFVPLFSLNFFLALYTRYCFTWSITIIIILDLNSHSFSNKIDVYIYYLSIIRDLINRRVRGDIFQIDFAIISNLELHLTFLDFKLQK